MNAEDYERLNPQYFEIFGEDIPLTVLPGLRSAAVSLVEKAIEAKDSSVLISELPEDSEI